MTTPAAPGVDGAIILEGSAAPDRIDRATFLARLRELSSSTAVEMLGERAHGCTYLEAWFARHETTDAAMLERMARRYGGVPGATTADALLESLRARLRMGIAYWQSGEDVSGELALAGLAESARAVGAFDVAGALAGDLASAQRVAAELGEGAPLASIGGSLAAIGGGSLAEARVHTGAAAERLAERADARAFTVGADIVLGADAPRPGTLAGDVLLAHEAAHVQQQAGGAHAPAPTATAEHDADLAGLNLLAARLGATAGFGRSVLATQLSLQRCKKTRNDHGHAGTAPAPADGGPRDAGADAPLDAAVPTWISTRITRATIHGRVRQSQFETVASAAAQFGGNRNHVARLITLFSQLQDPSFDPASIGPGTAFWVPRAIELPQPAVRLDNVDTRSSPAYETWWVEQHPLGAAHGRRPSVPLTSGGQPDASSGVTIGHGYDMGSRSSDSIEADLIAAGMAPAAAARYRGAQHLHGSHAQRWIAAQSLPALTAEQDELLFRIEYQRQTDALLDFIASPTLTGHDDLGYERVGSELHLRFHHLARLNPTILAFLVDLKFVGNLNARSWAYVHDAVRANNLEVLRARILDARAYYWNIHNNFNRYEARCRLLGISPTVRREVFEAYGR